MAALEVYVYRRDRERLKMLYAHAVNLNDMRDASINAAAALRDAEIHAGDYLLTGRAASRDAYRNDARDWQDESSTWELLAEHDAAIAPIREISRTGNRLMDELSATISLYDGGSHDAALDRFRKGSGVEDLKRVREQLAKAEVLDKKAVLQNDHLRLSVTLFGLRRVLRGAGVLFCLGFAGAALLLWQTRRERRAADSLEASARQPAATVD